MLTEGGSEAVPYSKLLEAHRVLVVEDNYLLAMCVADAVQSAQGDVVGPAPNVAMALACLENNQPIHAAILDLDLGGEKSYPIATALHRLRIPFIFLSGRCPEEAIIVHGPQIWCKKPASDEEMLMALAGVMGVSWPTLGNSSD